MSAPSRPLIRSLNDLLSCDLCKGYLIEATTTVECVHSFCKSCLVKHLYNVSYYCPKKGCGQVIHYSKPFKYIRSDPALQDLVYKLVPNLLQNELERQDSFYALRELPNPNKPTSSTAEPEPETPPKPVVLDPMNLGAHLIPIIPSQAFPNSYIKCNAAVTISVLKKLILLKVRGSTDNSDRLVTIYFNEDLLGRDHSLKFISLTRWKRYFAPMPLRYLIKED